MARINKSTLTRLEIIRAASQEFLENGYSVTTAKKICSKLNMSTGNLTFYFPTKEHLLAALVEIGCDFQREMMEREAADGFSSIMGICLELTAMAVMCEEDPVAKDFYIASYTSPLCLEVVRKRDAARAMELFREHCPDWTETQFLEAETLVSGIEYATLMTTAASPPLHDRVSCALRTILTLYQVPQPLRQETLDTVLAMDYQAIGRRILQEFMEYIEIANERALEALSGGKEPQKYRSEM